MRTRHASTPTRSHSIYSQVTARGKQMPLIRRTACGCEPQRILSTHTGTANMYDVAVLGGGISGMATAARLQAAGLATVVLESHGQPGGCAGFFRRKGFAFDVGATTLVDFSPGGVGGELLAHIGMPPPDGEALPGYV